MPDTSIFTVGGSVQAGGGLYIPRRTDEEFLTLCQDGEFVYILTPRQMGKSSLMIETAKRLKGDGVRTVIIDLSQIGAEVTAEEWYLGLLSVIEDQLTLDTDVFDWWEEHAHLGPTQSLTLFFREVALKEVETPLVIFVDEIDTTLSIPFSDDFYAAIRSMYNARGVTPVFRRLSFALIGVATPSDLMSDPKRTPFNVGQRLDLTDFTFEEALPFANGLGLPPEEAGRVLGWILEWTGGHPYLTQRLCRAVAETNKDRFSRAEVDDLVTAIFFGERSEQDNNLQFVRDMLTKRSADKLAVMETYREIRRGKRPVADQEQSQVKTHLKLSGVVQRSEGVLRLRNPIYAKVFDLRWVKLHWPEHWIKRIPPAVYAVIASLLIAVLSLYLLFAYASEAAEREATLRLEAQAAEARAQEAEALASARPEMCK